MYTHTHTKTPPKIPQLTAYILVHIYILMFHPHMDYSIYSGHNVMDQQSTPYINNLTNDI